jgi:hypothetical protein
MFEVKKYQIGKLIGIGYLAAAYPWVLQSVERWRSTEFVFEEETILEKVSSKIIHKFRVLCSTASQAEDFYKWSDLVYRCLQIHPWTTFTIEMALKIQLLATRQLFIFLSGWLPAAGIAKLSLSQLAYEHLGLPRTNSSRKCVQIVAKSAFELEQLRFIKTMQGSERFFKGKGGELDVLFERIPGVRG